MQTVGVIQHPADSTTASLEGAHATVSSIDPVGCSDMDGNLAEGVDEWDDCLLFSIINLSIQKMNLYVS